MSPTASPGQRLLFASVEALADIPVGSVVVFRRRSIIRRSAAGEGNLVMHRIVGKIPFSSIYIEKGDSPLSRPWPVMRQDILGVSAQLEVRPPSLIMSLVYAAQIPGLYMKALFRKIHDLVITVV